MATTFKKDSADAEANVHNPLLDDGTDDTEDTTEETTTEDSPDEEEEPAEDDSETDDPEVEKALQLYRALSDPATALNVIRSMAANAGILPADATPKEAKAAVKSIKERLLDNVPEGYEDIVNALAPLIERVVKEEVGEVRTEVTNEFARQAAEAFEKDYQKFVSNAKLQRAEEVELEKLVHMYPPQKAMPLDVYLSPLLEIVRGRQMKTKSKVETTTKQIANLGKRTPQVRSGESNENSMSERQNAMTPTEAVQLALRQLNKRG